MKKTLLLIGVLLSQNLFAQNEFPCNEEISTDPANPINNQQDSFDPSLQHFLNAFNWFGNDGVSTFDQIPYENLGPVFDPGGQTSGFFFSPYSSLGSSAYYDYLHQGGVDERDFYPQDGWELLSINLGYYPDLSLLPGAGSANPETPYIILYNKYKNIIRLFGTTTAGLTNPYNAVKVNLKFPASVSGLFNSISNETQSLDMPTEVTQIGMLAPHPDLANSLSWFHVDFPVSYDPCVCYFKSDILFEFEFFTIANIQLSGRSVGLPEDLIDVDGVPFDSKDFLSSVFNQPMVEAGAIIYKRQTDLIDAYIAKLEEVKAANANIAEYNEKINRYITILDLFKSSLIGGSLDVTTNVLTWAVDLVNGDNEINETKLEKFAEEILGLGFDKLKGLFKEKDKLSEPDMPVAIVTEMAFSGSITTDQVVEGPSIYNPGTYPNPDFSPTAELNYELYPAYNNALGSFALLNQPKIYKAIAELNLGDELLEISLGNSELFNMKEFHSTYQLKENLIYVFNPALDINYNETQIYASLIVKAQSPFEFVEDGAGAQYCEVNHSNFSPDVTTLEKGDLITNFVPIECFNEMIATIKYKHPNDYGVLNLNADEGLLVNFEDQVYLRLMIHYEFNSLNSDGNPNTSLEVMTYPVEVIMPNDFSVFSAFSTSYDLNDYPQNIVLGTQHFTQNTTIQAWNDIIINGDITADNGVIVNIIAGNEINVTPEGSVIPSGTNVINLTIQPVMSCTPPVAPADPSYIHNFCNGLLPSGNYMANSVQQLMVTSPSTTMLPIDLVAAPNNSNEFILSSKNNSDLNQNFILYDLSGKVLMQQNYLPTMINLNDFAQGLYLIEFSTENGVARKKLLRN